VLVRCILSVATGIGLWPIATVGAVNHFTGTASFYAEFRAGYPDDLWESLAIEAAVDVSCRVLDLGSGPATATLELAKRAGSVVAVDRDAGMVDQGRTLTRAAGFDNVEWVHGLAEDVDYPDGYFRLIVIASAFHWMDRPRVASKCRSMLDDGGILALLGNPTPLMQIREGTAVGAALGEVQDRWFDEDYYVLDTDQLDRPEVVLEQCGFSEVTISYVPQVQEWDVHRFLGFLRSTSSRPDQHLGDKFQDFAADIYGAVRAVEPSGRWTLEIPVEVIVGRP